jgi:hypothetical protein
MVGWLRKKGQDARVTMCVKEVKWELERGSLTKRATILALAQFLRPAFFGEGRLPDVAICHPLHHNQIDLRACYDILENNRNGQRRNTTISRRNERALFGRDLQQFFLDHTKAVERGTEVWMCTIGAGIVAGRRDDVRLIWAHLTTALDGVPDAIRELRQVGERLGADDLFAEVDTTEWIGLCKFAPAL